MGQVRAPGNLRAGPWALAEGVCASSSHQGLNAPYEEQVREHALTEDLKLNKIPR